MSAELYTIPVVGMDGSEKTLDAYEGKVLLMVNVASQCGLTPQYETLETLYESFKDEGLVVLGFPANEFGSQEPGTNAEIQQFCETRFSVRFPLFAKLVVKGEGQHPLYRYLTQAQPAAQAKSDSSLRGYLEKNNLLSSDPSDISWNFEKFLVNRQGEVVARFAPDITPDDPLLVDAIETELARA